MFGTIVNVAAILVGSILGMIFKGGIPEKINDTVMKGLALCILYIGIEGSLKAENFVFIIFSIVIGGVIGEIIDIDLRLKNFGDKIEEKMKGRGGKISEGFVTASLLFCVGAMAIIGAMESGLQHNYEKLYAKSILDGVSSIVFASTMGYGVALASISVFFYQGLITIAAASLKSLLTASVINDMTAVGGLLIIGLGLNMLGSAKVKVANLLPAVFIPVLYQIILGFIR